VSIPLSPSDQPIDNSAIRQQLDRILGSAGFAGSLRLRRFLQYAVDQQLAGDSAQLKEYAIGVEVFDRPANYDPRLDSIVRVEAGRLRSKLDEYYANDGAADAVRISLPRGSYVPVFERRAAEAARDQKASSDAEHESHDSKGGSVAPSGWSRRPAMIMLAAAVALVVAVFAGWRSLAEAPGIAPGISIAVLPFEAFSGSEADLRLADRMTDEVTTALARLGKLSVVSRTSARQFQGVRKPMHEIRDALGAQVIMEAAVEMEGDGLLIQPRLVDATIDRKFWVGTYRGSRTDPRELAARIAAGVTEAVLKRKQNSRTDRSHRF
jgi:TolB-like protein